MQHYTFAPDSRVWVYTSDRPLNKSEQTDILAALAPFCESWTAHNNQLKAGAELLFGRLLVLIVDESQAGASGCSIDTSVQFLRRLGQAHGCDFLGRNLAGIKPGSEWEWIDYRLLPELLVQGKIGPDTPVLDVNISQYAGLQRMEKPLADSWMKRYLKP